MHVRTHDFSTRDTDAQINTATHTRITLIKVSGLDSVVALSPSLGILREARAPVALSREETRPGGWITRRGQAQVDSLAYAVVADVIICRLDEVVTCRVERQGRVDT
jgi:hypothetical protein